MKHLIALVSTAALISLGAGCATPYGAPVWGGIYTGEVRGPVTGVDNAVKQTKTGVAQATGIVCFATGDASISAAMKAGGINKVHHVDSETFSILGVYSVYKTMVYGE